VAVPQPQYGRIAQRRANHQRDTTRRWLKKGLVFRLRARIDWDVTVLRSYGWGMETHVGPTRVGGEVWD